MFQLFNLGRSPSSGNPSHLWLCKCVPDQKMAKHGSCSNQLEMQVLLQKWKILMRPAQYILHTYIRMFFGSFGMVSHSSSSSEGLDEESGLTRRLLRASAANEPMQSWFVHRVSVSLSSSLVSLLLALSSSLLVLLSVYSYPSDSIVHRSFISCRYMYIYS